MLQVAYSAFSFFVTEAYGWLSTMTDEKHDADK